MGPACLFPKAWLDWNKEGSAIVRKTGQELALTGSTRVLGVIGNPVAHSVSPAMHNAAIASLGLDYVYVPFRVEQRDVGCAVEAIRALGIVGMNVTVPHKEAVLGLMDDVSEDARVVGSVNTITNAGGILRGDSTDGRGFMRSLRELGIEPNGLKAAVVGAGGSAKATVFALASAGAKVAILNRTRERAVELAEKISAVLGNGVINACGLDPESVKQALGNAELLVNCTSVGMYPNPLAMPVPKEALHPGLLVYDQVYNPRRTLLLKTAEEIGARTGSGLKMLVYQGAISFEKWTGVEPPVDVMEQAGLEALRAFSSASSE
jgi:shikimate dehydrogenase